MRFSFENDFEKKKFLSLLKQQQSNIDYLLYMRDVLLNDQAFISHTKIEEINAKKPFENKVLLIENVLKNLPTKNSYIKNNLQWDSHLLSIEEYISNPYLLALKRLTFNEKGWQLKQEKIPAYNLFVSAEEYAIGSDMSIKPSFGFFDKDYFYPSILLENKEWMSLNPHEIKTMEIPIMTARGKVLTLGLGLGYFTYMASLKEEVKEVHIVEMDLDLINLFIKYLLPLFPFPEKIHIHKADAFHFIENIKDHDYDFIFSDLWHDVSDGIISYLLLRKKFDSFGFTKRYYWIEDSLITYLRLLVIGVMNDEYYQNKNDYDVVQKIISDSIESIVLTNSYELDALLNIKGLRKLLLT